MPVLHLADLFIACFITLLFVSIYRKRRMVAVRCWTAGWFCVLLHFAALVPQPHTARGGAAQGLVALCTLGLAAVAFALSAKEVNVSRRRRTRLALLLGGPWLLVMVVGSLWPGATTAVILLAFVSADGVLVAAYALFGWRRARFAVSVVLVLGCAAWLLLAGSGPDGADTAQAVNLTLSFGFIAVLLGARVPRLSTANITVSLGALSWASVWATAAALQHGWPQFAPSPELWNLPKYFLAAGMVLSLLDEEIRATGRSSEEYRLLFEGNPQPMWIYDPETLRFLEVNEATVREYGFSRAEFRGMLLTEMMGEGAADAQIFEVFRSAEPQTLTGPWRHRRRDGTELSVDIASQPVWREGRRAISLLIHDVTEGQEVHRQLLQQAHHDGLTGLPNRVLFEARLDETVLLAREQNRSAAVFCIDLDRFKQINDTFGHAAGDQCLCAMADRINAVLKGRGTLARTGGDEFMLVLGDLGAAAVAESIADDLVRALEPALTVENSDVELVASIGVALFPQDGDCPADLWRDADAAMYRAKRAGGAQWVRVSREISAAVAEANEVELRLRRALRTGGLRAVYQPQLTAAGKLHSLEALVRFADPVLAAAPAEKVIALAEDTGMIVPLGEWMLDEVCRQARAWRDRGAQPLRIALNVSALQVQRFDFALKVASALDRYDLAPQSLELEVTESTVMPDRGAAPEQVALLARMGVAFAVDDFGTGYSSLGRLHQLPVDSLKIDRSFTQQITDPKGTYPTVRAIIGLAHTFGMAVVAEGVEMEEQLQILRSLGCDRMQGFLFSRPIPADAIGAMLSPQVEAAPLGQAAMAPR